MTRFFYRCLILTTLFLSPQLHAFEHKINNIDESHKEIMIFVGSYSDGCPVPIERLRRVEFSYYDFKAVEHHDGEIIVMDAVADNVVNIFRELHKLQFPIHKARRIENYQASDERSLDDNNTSSFNCREIVGESTLPSIHAYGLAIDINPWQNPYVGFPEENNVPKVLLLPSQGTKYLNRTNIRAGMAEQVVNIFKDNGFTIWGGKWNTPIDWQHFQTPRALAETLAQMDSTDAVQLFKLYAKNSIFIDKLLASNKDEFIKTYIQHKPMFVKAMKNSINDLAALDNSSDAMKLIQIDIQSHIEKGNA